MAAKKKRTTKKKQQHPPKTEHIYVGVKDPNAVHKHVLETSKEFLVYLQKYEKVKSIRVEKLRLIKQFSTVIGGLKKDLHSIVQDIPQPPPTAEVKTVVKHKKVHKPKHKVQTPHLKKQSSEIDQLEQELLEIERKLANL
ncbi:MAG: hypothetical protein ACMXYA_01960 [Candidatus Woesearchaeota archaeon]